MYVGMYKYTFTGIRVRLTTKLSCIRNAYLGMLYIFIVLFNGDKPSQAEAWLF